MIKPASRLSILSLSLLAVSAAFASDEPKPEKSPNSKPSP